MSSTGVQAVALGVCTGTATSNPFTPSQAGTYRWKASYSGDTNNAGTATACNDPGETSVVNEVAQTPGTVTGGSALNVTEIGRAHVRTPVTDNLRVTTT